MNPYTELREELAKFLGAALDLVGIAGPPAQLAPGQVFVRHGAPYISWADEGMFGVPVVRLSAVIVAPNIDAGQRWAWIDDKIADVRAALLATERIGPCRRPAITSIGAPGALEGTEHLAVELQFSPIPIGAAQ